jgi:hypothetical protein
VSNCAWAGAAVNIISIASTYPHERLGNGIGSPHVFRRVFQMRTRPRSAGFRQPKSPTF